MKLEDHLSAIYANRVVGLAPDKKGVDPAQRFERALADSPALQAEARAWLVHKDGVDDDRCFVTRKHRQFLNAALSSL